jgi:hypothetical protein
MIEPSFRTNLGHPVFVDKCKELPIAELGAATVPAYNWIEKIIEKDSNIPRQPPPVNAEVQIRFGRFMGATGRVTDVLDQIVTILSNTGDRTLVSMPCLSAAIINSIPVFCTVVGCHAVEPPTDGCSAT